MSRNVLFRRAFLLFAVPFAILAGASAHAQGNTVARDIDPALWRTIEGIPAFDNHAHPVLAPPEDASDRNFDALPVDNMAPQTDPVAWKADNPQLPAAWAALWGFKGAGPLDNKGMQELQAARARVKQREMGNYPSWVLKQAGIGTMLANRVSMGAGVEPPQFRWVPYVDALLFPLDNSGLGDATPDRAQFFPLEDRLRRRYLEAVGLHALPATLDDYLRLVVSQTLERQKREGAVAVKFELAYLRSFDISDPSRAEAAAAYEKWVASGRPDPAAYKLLQDFLFRYIALESGRLGLAVHLHAMSGGGRYFGIAGANPLLLEPLFNDVRLRNTRFVLLHGGWPFVRETGALLQKPNVYLDISQQSLTFPARTLAGWLREWLETFPDKVLFGTDGYPFSASMGWEEATWIASDNARQALGLALTGMIRDGEISRARANAIANQVLRANAESLYGKQ
ncbi:MAG TPA: amidohydrolase family protein [Terracidiphilus sp.]|jgi:predicted TIM-barrel fold metal-dependent hydrolase|nr:amidohydrolase family protein [Terracidiphilus sp.]